MSTDGKCDFRVIDEWKSRPWGGGREKGKRSLARMRHRNTCTALVIIDVSSLICKSKI